MPLRNTDKVASWLASKNNRANEGDRHAVERCAQLARGLDRWLGDEMRLLDGRVTHAEIGPLLRVQADRMNQLTELAASIFTIDADSALWEIDEIKTMVQAAEARE